MKLSRRTTFMAVAMTMAVVGAYAGSGALAKPISQAPPGNLTSNPSTVSAGSTVNEVFRFTAKKAFTTADTLKINRAPDWSPYQITDKGTAGYVVLQKSTCTVGALTIDGSGFISVAGVKCPKANQWVQVSYFNPVAPSTVRTSTFQAWLLSAPSALMPANIAVVAGPVASLAWTQHPTTAVAGAAIAPSPAVLARDQYGNATSTVVNLALGAATPATTGVLSGTASHSTVLGIATFPGLSVNKVGSGYTLLATAAAVTTPVPSAAFNITASPASATMALGLSRSVINADGRMSATATATVTDGFGNGVPGLTGVSIG